MNFPAFFYIKNLYFMNSVSLVAMLTVYHCLVWVLIEVLHLQQFRFYLGLALALKKDRPGARVKEAVTYLLEAFETLMTERTKQAVTSTPEKSANYLLTLKKINVFVYK